MNRADEKPVVIKSKETKSSLKDRSRWWSGLRFRMTISYALTTVAALLFIEILIGTTIWAILSYSTVADIAFSAGAEQTARVYALAAAAQAGGTMLDPQTTFEPGKPSSIALSKEFFSGSENIQYKQGDAFALLIGPDDKVLASS